MQKAYVSTFQFSRQFHFLELTDCKHLQVVFRESVKSFRLSSRLIILNKKFNFVIMKTNDERYKNRKFLLL